MRMSRSRKNKNDMGLRMNRVKHIYNVGDSVWYKSETWSVTHRFNGYLTLIHDDKQRKKKIKETSLDNSDKIETAEVHGIKLRKFLNEIDQLECIESHIKQWMQMNNLENGSMKGIAVNNSRIEVRVNHNMHDCITQCQNNLSIKDHNVDVIDECALYVLMLQDYKKTYNNVSLLMCVHKIVHLV